MTNAIRTSQWLTSTKDYVYEQVVDRVYTAANTITGLLMQHAKTSYHGGLNSYYPYVAAKHNSSHFYSIMGTGAIAADTPSDTDFQNAMHQEGWGYWETSTAISPKTYAINVGPHASKDRIFDESQLKYDMLVNAISECYELNFIQGDGTNNTILGLAALFDLDNTNYLGANFATSEIGFVPKSTTFATNQNSLTFADLISLYTDLEEYGQEADYIVGHPNALKRLRVISEATVQRTQGGNTQVGTMDFSVLNAKWINSRNVPTTTASVIYFLNFGNAIKVDEGAGGKNKLVNKNTAYFSLEFAGPQPYGFELTDWVHRYDYGARTLELLAAGAFKMACTKTEAQGVAYVG